MRQCQCVTHPTQGQQERTFYNSFYHSNNYGGDDGPGMLYTLTHCILNDKPTQWMPILFPFLGMKKLRL